MKFAVRTDLKRAIDSKGFLLSILGLCLLGIGGILQNIASLFHNRGLIGNLQKGYALQMMLDALGSEPVLLFLPVLCALPHAASFVEDFQSKYYRAYMPRTGKKAYISARLFSTILSGGLAMLIGALLLILLFCVAFSPMEIPKDQLKTEFYASYDYGAYLSSLHWQLVGRVLLLFLNGCFWACIGGLFAALVINKYMAYAAPFILYYVMIILEERYFSSAYMLNPKLWMDPQLPGAGSVWSMALFVLELVMLAVGAYGFAMARRMRDV